LRFEGTVKKIEEKQVYPCAPAFGSCREIFSKLRNFLPRSAKRRIPSVSEHLSNSSIIPKPVQPYRHLARTLKLFVTP
jgi:hypothetical protein